jgi:hypothetical protein
MPTCGWSKLSESSACASICALNTHEELRLSLRTEVALSIESCLEQHHGQGAPPKCQWVAAPGREFVVDQKYPYRDAKGMVEEVKELESDPQYSALPAGNLRVLHDGEVCIEVAGSAKAIEALREKHSGTATET